VRGSVADIDRIIDHHRPKTTWRRTIENEIKERGYTWGTIERKANNREVWRKLVLALCAMRHSKI
jgi:hypothetical protein